MRSQKAWNIKSSILEKYKSASLAEPFAGRGDYFYSAANMSAFISSIFTSSPLCSS